MDYNGLIQEIPPFFHGRIYISLDEKKGEFLILFFYCTRIDDYLRIGAR